MKVSAVLACSLSGSFLEAKCSENGPRREPKSLKIALEKLPPKTIVFLIDFGSEKAPKSIPLGFFRGPFSVLGALGPQNVPNRPQGSFFHTFPRISRVFAHIFQCFSSFPGDPCGNLRRFLQHIVMSVLCVSLIFVQCVCFVSQSSLRKSTQVLFGLLLVFRTIFSSAMSDLPHVPCGAFRFRLAASGAEKRLAALAVKASLRFS